MRQMNKVLITLAVNHRLTLTLATLGFTAWLVHEYCYC